MAALIHMKSATTVPRAAAGSNRFCRRSGHSGCCQSAVPYALLHSSILLHVDGPMLEIVHSHTIISPLCECSIPHFSIEHITYYIAMHWWPLESRHCSTGGIFRMEDKACSVIVTTQSDYYMCIIHMCIQQTNKTSPKQSPR